LRQDGGTARPDLDHFVLARSLRRFCLFQDIAVDERAFPYGTGHGSAPFLLGVTRPDNHLVGGLVRAGAVTFGALAPRGNRVTAARGAAFAAAVRVVDRVHRNAAHRRADALIAHAARFTEVLVRVVGVRHGADSGHAFLTHQTQFARRKADLRVGTVAADELGIGARGARQLAA